jgi:DNA-binding GntR family transcriptional regulator
VADCARNADATVKGRLAEVLDKLDNISKGNSPPAILDVTTEFYAIIFEASGHNIAWEIVSRLNSRISRLRVMTLSTTNRTVSGPAQLREILACIKRNDSNAAAAACRAHIQAAAAIAEAVLAE